MFSSRLVHRLFNPVQERHCRHATGGAGFRFSSLADGADEFHGLTIKGRHAVERNFFSFAVGHGVTVNLEGVVFADVAVETAEWSSVVERQSLADQRPFL